MVTRILILVCLSSTLDATTDNDQAIADVYSNSIDLYAAERIYDEQELGAKFDPVTGKRRYDNYEVVKVKPTSEEQLNVLRFLEKGMIELWNPLPSNVSLIDSVDILVSPQHVGHVRSYLECSGMKTETVIQNLQAEIDLENVKSEDSEDSGLEGRPGYCFSRTGMTWVQYHRLSTMNQYIDCLAEDHRDKVEIIDIGRSSEGRALRVLKLGRANKVLKPAIWVDGGIHAREWVSPAAVLYAIRELVENEDPANSVLNNYDIYILPVANPDGYEYSHEVDRMWRKTRSSNNGACRGVDPNRNWGFRWGGEGASTSPCSETYRGPRPFSEPETAAIRDFILQRNTQIKIYITFHSFGQYILYPWGYAAVDSEDSNDLHAMGDAAADAINRVTGRGYSVGSAAKMLYPAAGGSDDWAKGGAGIKYSYTIELPDRGQHGFILPAQHIESVGKEAHAALLAMISVL